MQMTRRDMIGLTSAAGAIGLADPLVASIGSSTALDRTTEIIRRLTNFAAADLADKGLPGITVAVIGRNGFQATLASGLADVDRHIPVTPGHLFQIGSITKSLTAMAVFVLADRGKLDLDARVQDLLPDHPLPPEPITLAQLLDHSSGLSATSSTPPASIEAPGGRLWTGSTPGARYSYSNLGYGLLGDVIESVSGVAYPLALETLVLKPLGMTKAVPLIQISDREAFASGHVCFREDVPWLPKARLAPARWFDFSLASGCVAAGPADMIQYLRYLSGLARGKGGPLFSDALAERFRTPTISSGSGDRYGNGLRTISVDGRPCFRHTGGMLGFSSAFTLDMESGVGCFASVNVGGAGEYRPTEITEYAIALLRHADGDQPFPSIRAPRPAPRVKDGARFAGRWLSADGGELMISDRDGVLFIASGGSERPLRATGRTTFVTDHPALDPYILVFDGETARLRLGGRLFGRGTPPPAQPADPRLAMLGAVYHSRSSFAPGGRIKVFAAGGRLFLGDDELVSASDGSWRFKSLDKANERIWFQKPIRGRPQMLNFSGVLYNRLKTQAL